MADEQLKISISGDASGLEKASQDAAAALSKVDKSAEKTSTALATIPKASDQVSTSLDKASKVASSALTKIDKSAAQTINTLGNIPKVSAQVVTAASTMAKSADIAGGAMSTVKKGGDQATQALVNLSRVAQDAPYGFIGIANNINPLLESFQRLQKETGSTKSALSALGNSLAGAGGLGLIVGIASSLLVVFGDKLFSSAKTADTLAESLKKVGDEADLAGRQIQSLSGDLDFLNQAAKLKIEVSGGLDSQAITEQIQNTKEAVDKIKLIRKQLEEKKDAVNIFDFKVGTKGREEAEAAVQKLSDAITKTIDDEADQSKKLFFLQQQLRISTNKESKEALDKQEEDRKKAESRATAAARKSNEDFKEWMNARKAIIAEFSKDFEGIKIFTLPDVGDPKDNKELFERLNKRLQSEALRQIPVKIKLPVEVTITQDLKTGKIDISEKLKDIQAIDPEKVPIPLKPTITWQPSDFQKQYENFIGQVQNIIKDAESNLAINFGEGIAAAISGDGLEKAFQNIAVIAGDFLQQLGKLLIKESVLIAGFKKAFAALIANPIAGLAVGVALVAAGALLKNLALPKPKGFAKGGMVPGQGSGDTVPAMLTPGEFVVTKDKAPFIASLLKALGSGIKLPQLSAGVFKFAEGGFVPQGIDRTPPLNRTFINNSKVEFPAYLPAFEMSHDKFRLWYNRANKYGNTFGR